MKTIRIRVTGNEAHSNALITRLHGVDGIERVEEVAELMPLDDDDTSSLGLTDDMGPGVHEIEVEAPNATAAERIREIAGDAAEELDVTVEFVDEF